MRLHSTFFRLLTANPSPDSELVSPKPKLKTACCGDAVANGDGGHSYE